MSKVNWETYYSRWSERFRLLNNKKEFIDKVIKKYGYKKNVAENMLFDGLYEYAKRYGKLMDYDDEFDFLCEEYDVDKHKIALCFTEKPFIMIR